MEPLISIIVPVYNVESYLDQCVRSCISQTHTNLEILLVDDGSTDSSPEICDAWAQKDNRIRVIHQDNAGPTLARNTGQKSATGDYLTFIDADDWIDSTMCEYLLRILLEEDADISKIQAVHVHDEHMHAPQVSEKLRVYDREEYARRFFKIGSQSIEYYLWNKLYRRSTIDDQTFQGTYTVGDDVVDTYRIILKANKIVESRLPMYYYRMGSGMTNEFKDSYFSLQDVWDEVYSIAEEQAPQHLEYVRINQARIIFTILTQLAVSGKSDLPEYKENKERLLRKLHEDKCLLLNADIAASRKLLIRWFLFDYNTAAAVLSRLIRHRQ